jgi:hypothetical protein
LPELRSYSIALRSLPARLDARGSTYDQFACGYRDNNLHAIT